MSKSLTPKEESIVAACAFTPKYSGDESVKFWKEVVASGDRTLYIFGCALQDIESRVLQTLNPVVRDSARKFVISRRGKRKK